MKFHSPSISSCKGALLAAITALIIVNAGSISSASACTILVVKNADLKPYEDAIRGFRNASVCTVRERKLSSAEEVSEMIVRLRPDAVVAVGTGAFKLSAAVTGIPVIHLMVMPSEASRALRQNISGVNMDPAPAAYFSAMAESFPRAKRIGLVYDPRFMGAYVADAERTARNMGISLTARRVDSPSAIPAALDELRGKIDVLWMLPDPTVVTAGTVELLLQYSFRNNVPVFTFSRKYVEMGAVASLDVDPYDMGNQAAGVTGRMIEDAAEPMRVYARKHELTINEIVAAKMGIAIGNGEAGRPKRDD